MNFSMFSYKKLSSTKTRFVKTSNLQHSQNWKFCSAIYDITLFLNFFKIYSVYLKARTIN